MLDREQLLDELALVFARAAVDALLAEEIFWNKNGADPAKENGAVRIHNNVDDTSSSS